MIPGSGRSPGGGHGNSLQYSCLQNPMDTGAWWAPQSIGLQRVRHNWTDLACTHTQASQILVFWYYLLPLGSIITPPVPLEKVPSMQVKDLCFTILQQQLKIMACLIISIYERQSCPLWAKFTPGIRAGFLGQITQVLVLSLMLTLGPGQLGYLSLSLFIW